MKNKKVIIFIILIVISLLILGCIYLSKQEKDLTVTLYYIGKDLEFDFETHSYKYDKIELTPEQEKEIIKLYNRTSTRKTKDLDLAIIGTIKLEFSDGNVIIMDRNDDSYGYINNEYSIELSNGFKEYILNIIY